MKKKTCFRTFSNKIKIAIINVFLKNKIFFLKKIEKKIFIYINQDIRYRAGYPVAGKIIGRISGQISIRYNPRHGISRFLSSKWWLINFSLLQVYKPSLLLSLSWSRSEARVILIQTGSRYLSYLKDTYTILSETARSPGDHYGSRFLLISNINI